MKLIYESNWSNLNSPQYNGSISAMIWQAKSGGRHSYAYQYDQLYQLSQAHYVAYSSGWSGNAGRFDEQAAYDLNGNTTSLRRGGKINWATNAYGTMDSLSFGYIGNQLKSVNDTVRDITNNQKYDFSDYGREAAFIPNDTNTYEYWYDENGNLSRNNAKGISITYNYMNMPTVVDFGGGKRIEWSYAASGEKLRKTVYVNDTIATTLDYVSGLFDYRNGTLDFFYCEYGRVKRLSNGALRQEYNITDQLGNSRVFFADTNADGAAEVLQESHYYAFGMRIEGLGTQNDNKYLFNGKELTDDYGLNWYEYGWRTYDAQIGRWHQVDPMDELHSPYCFVANNPINLIDPDGAQIGPSDNLPFYESPEEIVITAFRTNWNDMLANWFYSQANGIQNRTQIPIVDDINYMAYRDLGDLFSSNSRADQRIYSGLSLAMTFIPFTTEMNAGRGGLRTITGVSAALEKHIIPRHTASGIEAFAEKSKFNEGVNLEGLVEKANNAVIAFKVESGNIARVIDAGTNIGVDRATGAQTSVYTVITTAEGLLKTMFPGLP